MDNLHCKRKPSHANTKLTLFTVRKDEWDTKEDAEEPIKNALYVLVAEIKETYAKTGLIAYNRNFDFRC